MQTGITIMENSIWFPQKIKIRLPDDSVISPEYIYPKEMEMGF